MRLASTCQSWKRGSRTDERRVLIQFVEEDPASKAGGSLVRLCGPRVGVFSPEQFVDHAFSKLDGWWSISFISPLAPARPSTSSGKANRSRSLRARGPRVPGPRRSTCCDFTDVVESVTSQSNRWNISCRPTLHERLRPSFDSTSALRPKIPRFSMRCGTREFAAHSSASRLAFVLVSKLYRQMYANTGIATDSARVARSARRARWIGKACRRLFLGSPMPNLQLPG